MRRRMVQAAMILLLAPGAARPQSAGGVLRGQVADESGAVIPGAPVAIAGPGVQKTISSGADGSYSVPDLAPGQYTVRVVYTGFGPFETRVEITAGHTTDLPIALHVSLEKQEVTVAAEGSPQVSVEPDNNAGALVLRGADLEALPDDPDDLAADLQALAGPSAGPNGGQIYIDGFSGGRLPPKESIREIRINQNPFSAEFDSLGFGRIEVFTKPGSDKFRGQAFFNFTDQTFDSRNPFAANKPDFQSRMFGGSFSGPLSKRASFFVDLEKRDVDDNAIINVDELDPSLNPLRLQEAVLQPNRRTTISPRIDYQLSKNNTLMARYSWSGISTENTGVGQFNLTSRGYNTRDRQQMVTVTETAVIHTTVVNETRFQFVRSHNNEYGDNSIPAITVLDSFSGGGAQVGDAYNDQNHYEIQNNTSFSHGVHTVRFGVRVRTDNLASYSPGNFGGTFTFSGGIAPLLNGDTPLTDASGNPVLRQIDSLERYRRTLYYLQQGLPMSTVRSVYGGGPSQFTIAGGVPLASVSQTDLGTFLLDDWKLRPNFTLSLGLRYETQTNIHDWHDWAPRVGFAWSPDAIGRRQGKTVIRGGYGMFYTRFAESMTLQALRFNGVNQQQYIVQNPDFFPPYSAVPGLSSLTPTSQALWRVAGNLRTPYVMQSAIGMERQLPRNTVAAVTFTDSHAMHLLRTRNINAPYPGLGMRPDPTQGDIDEYESSGVYNQKQLIANVTNSLSRRVTVTTFYIRNYAKSDTDGGFPANQYNLAGEYGRAAQDVRNRFMFISSVVAPLALRFSPMVMVSSGRPYNITTGIDNNGDNIFFDRPAFATDPTRRGVVMTPYGLLDPNPIAGEAIIPRNFAEGPGQVSVNLRMSRTWGFGGTRGNRAVGSASDQAGFGGPGGGRGGPGGGGRGGMGGGGGRGGFGGGMGGMRMGGGGGRGGFDGGTTEQRYNLTLSVSARNLLNTLNPGPPVGSISSPLFGQSTQVANAYGPLGGAANRRIELQLRFMF